MTCNKFQQRYTIRKYICLFSSMIPCMKYSGAMFPFSRSITLAYFLTAMGCPHGRIPLNTVPYPPFPTMFSAKQWQIV
jgi:hypothetical protein